MEDDNAPKNFINPINAFPMQIHLKSLKFHAYHGLHTGEDILGGEYEVGLSVTYLPQNTIVKEIGETVDYVALYQLVKERMAIKTPLIETIGTEIAHEIISRFPIVSSVEISIFKLHPPIEQFEGSVGITYHLTR